MLKKTLTLLLTLLLCLSVFVACAPKTSEQSPETESLSTENIDVPPASDDNDVIVDESIPAETPELNYENYEFDMTFKFEKQIAYQDDDITITIHDLVWDDYEGLRLIYGIEDKQGRPVDVGTHTFQINDALLYSYMDWPEDEDLSATKFIPKELSFYQIKDVYSFIIQDMYVYNTDTYEEIIPMFNCVVNIQNDNTQHETKFVGETLIESDEATVLLYNAQFGLYDEICPTIHLFNRYDKDLSILIKNIRVNDNEPFDDDSFKCNTIPGTNCAENLQMIIEGRIAPEESINKVVVDIVVQTGSGDIIANIENYELDWDYERVWGI